MDDKILKILKKVLSHKPFEINGVICKFHNIVISEKNFITDVDIEVPSDKSWIAPQLKQYCYDAIGENLEYLGVFEYYLNSQTFSTFKVGQIRVNGAEMYDEDLSVTKKDHQKLHKILSRFPKKLLFNLDGFTMVFETKFDNKFDIEVGWEQLYINVGFDITKIILSNEINDKKVVITTLPEGIVESIYSWLTDGDNEEMEDLRVSFEGELYSDYASEVFDMGNMDVSLTCYLLPQNICGIKPSEYTGGDVEVEEYFKTLALKSLD